jgi:hypothetical protein
VGAAAVDGPRVGGAAAGGREVVLQLWMDPGGALQLGKGLWCYSCGWTPGGCYSWGKGGGATAVDGPSECCGQRLPYATQSACLRHAVGFLMVCSRQVAVDTYSWRCCTPASMHATTARSSRLTGCSQHDAWVAAIINLLHAAAAAAARFPQTPLPTLTLCGTSST